MTVLRLLFVSVLALGGCGIVVVKPADDPSSEAKPTSASVDEQPVAKPAAKNPQIDIRDLTPRVAAARAKLATDPDAAAKELAAVRAEIWTRYEKLEVTPDDPFHSDSLSDDAKTLLATTHTSRAGVFADRGNADDALRELLMPLRPVSTVRCSESDDDCRKAHAAVSKRYKGFCWNFNSSECSARLDDDAFAWNKDSTTRISRSARANSRPTRSST